MQYIATNGCRHVIRQADSTRPEIHDWLYAGAPKCVTIVDPPYQFPPMRWTDFITDPSIVFCTASRTRLVPEYLYRFERAIIKNRQNRVPSTKVMVYSARVVQCGAVKTCPKQRGGWSDVVEFTVPNGFRHEKPVDLIVDHLSLWTPPVDRLVDPFAGSLTSVLAADIVGLPSRAVELESGALEYGLNRLKKAGFKIRRHS